MPEPRTTAAPPRGRWRELWDCVRGILRQRCPRCREGRVFRGSLTMNDPCPVCGLIFQREEGYFLGAMYFSYLLSSALITAFFFAASALLPDWSGFVVAGLAVVLYLPFIPAVFRYSRLLWIYLDRGGDYSDANAGPYEKMRRQQLAEQARRRLPRGPSHNGSPG
jgi:uncharacterized protein (DUF983 family)